MSSRSLPILAATAALAACTSSPPPVMIDVEAVERGRALAQRACSGCHGVGANDASMVGVPRFRELSHRDVLAIDYTLAKAAAGHPMPPRWLTASERRDVAAYIASLD